MCQPETPSTSGHSVGPFFALIVATAGDFWRFKHAMRIQ
jgi:hypothetical protein